MHIKMSSNVPLKINQRFRLFRDFKGTKRRYNSKRGQHIPQTSSNFSIIITILFSME